MRPYSLLPLHTPVQKGQAARILSAVYALENSTLLSATHITITGKCAAAVLLVQHVKDRVEINSQSGEYRGRTDDLLHAMQAL